MTIYYHPRFQRSYKRLDPQLRKAADKRIALFRKDRFDPRLDTHRLHGKLKGSWSFSVDSRRHRILFDFLTSTQDEVVFLDIGNHSLYQ
jgi:mRNA-degrading endonuclease YafQ of YafQ-DinJ toxin-antitoxin module